MSDPKEPALDEVREEIARIRGPIASALLRHGEIGVQALQLEALCRLALREHEARVEAEAEAERWHKQSVREGSDLAAAKARIEELERRLGAHHQAMAVDRGEECPCCD